MTDEERDTHLIQIADPGTRQALRSLYRTIKAHTEAQLEKDGWRWSAHDSQLLDSAVDGLD